MAMPRGLLLCGAAAAVLALAARLLLAPQPAGEFPAFEAVAPGVRRLNFWWRPLPVVAAPVATFLVNVTDAAGAAGLVLVDAGVPDAPAVRGLLQRLSAEAAPLRLLVGAVRPAPSRLLSHAPPLTGPAGSDARAPGPRRRARRAAGGLPGPGRRDARGRGALHGGPRAAARALLGRAQ